MDMDGQQLKYLDMKMEKIKEPTGKMIIDSKLGEMTQDGLYLNYKDVITMMCKYSDQQNKELIEELNDLKKKLIDSVKLLQNCLLKNKIELKQMRISMGLSNDNQKV